MPPIKQIVRKHPARAFSMKYSNLTLAYWFTGQPVPSVTIPTATYKGAWTIVAMSHSMTVVGRLFTFIDFC